jgi:hypothetical protein
MGSNSGILKGIVANSWNRLNHLSELSHKPSDSWGNEHWYTLQLYNERKLPLAVFQKGNAWLDYDTNKGDTPHSF